MSSRKSTNIRILLSLNGDLRKIGDVTIGKLTGDIYYAPSSKQYLTENSEKEDIIHFGFHKSGYIHLKHKDKQNKPIRKGSKTENIGYQELFRDLILEPAKLSTFGKQVSKRDIVFSLNNEQKAILFSLAIISGKLIVKRYKGEDTPLSFKSVKDTDKVLGLEKRALGYQSGNSDKLLQFFLIMAEGNFSEMRTKRRIAILPDQKISNY